MTEPVDTSRPINRAVCWVVRGFTRVFHGKEVAVQAHRRCRGGATPPTPPRGGGGYRGGDVGDSIAVITEDDSGRKRAFNVVRDSQGRPVTRNGQQIFRGEDGAEYVYDENARHRMREIKPPPPPKPRNPTTLNGKRVPKDTATHIFVINRSKGTGHWRRRPTTQEGTPAPPIPTEWKSENAKREARREANRGSRPRPKSKSGKTVKELREEARRRGIPINSRMRKAELEKALGYQ